MDSTYVEESSSILRSTEAGGGWTGENWHSSHMLSPPILRSTEAGGGWGGENWHSSLMFN